jgi:hypothetical protein
MLGYVNKIEKFLAKTHFHNLKQTKVEKCLKRMPA